MMEEIICIKIYGNTFPQTLAKVCVGSIAVYRGEAKENCWGVQIPQVADKKRKYHYIIAV